MDVFFQCLEGEQHIVEKLFQNIMQDSRHKKVKVLLRNKISKRMFKSWPMKYVPVQDRVEKLLAANGFSTFNPYKFNQKMIDEMLEILSEAKDPTNNDTVKTPNIITRIIRHWSYRKRIIG